MLKPAFAGVTNIRTTQPRAQEHPANSRAKTPGTLETRSPCEPRTIQLHYRKGPKPHLEPGNLRKTHLGLGTRDTLTRVTMPRATVSDSRGRWVGGVCPSAPALTQPNLPSCQSHHQSRHNSGLFHKGIVGRRLQTCSHCSRHPMISTCTKDAKGPCDTRDAFLFLSPGCL